MNNIRKIAFYNQHEQNISFGYASNGYVRMWPGARQNQ